MNLQLPDDTARRSPAGWWSLTPPSHPYSLRSGTFLLPYPAVTDCLHFHKRSVLCCPDFPLAPTQDASDRPWHCFQPAKLRKKVVKNNGFWKINAFRPEIKAKRGRTWKFKNRDNAKLGGLMKELGFLHRQHHIQSASCFSRCDLLKN